MQLTEEAFHCERELLKKHGLKATSQRLVILKELLMHKDHPTVNTIFSKVKPELPAVSVDTIYRTLLAFADAGLCTALDGLGEARRFDPVTANHHHFICSKCEEVFDFTFKEFDTLKAPSELKNGFVIKNKTVRLFGLCPNCNKKEKKTKEVLR